MKINKISLLAAVAVSALGTAANAQFAIGRVTDNTTTPPTVTNNSVVIVGAGASLPQNIVRQGADCYGLKTVLGFGVSSGTAEIARTLFDFDFNTPANDTLANRFNCAGNESAGPLVAVDPDGAGPLPPVPPNFGAPRIVQPNVTVRYLSTGSGQGVTAFLNNRVSASFFSNGFNGAGTTTTYADTDGYQYSLSETALSSTNITTYNTTPINPFNRFGTVATTAAAAFGAPIQVPFVLASVAVAYAPVYAKERNAGGFINSYRFTVTGARADGSGGLKLTRAQYCGIFNGVITNWNQLPTNVVNRDINDAAPFNVPIRLVGRSETSGTTSLFTRAMARQCDPVPNVNGELVPIAVNTGVGGTAPSTPITNKFGNSENRLPFDGVVTVTGTAYTGTVASTISPTQSISGAFFDKGTQQITIGTEATGLFTIANGNDGVAGATALHPDPGPNAGDRTLNGRVAYVSPEQTLPAILFSGANGFGLNTASLQVNGTGTVFVAPDAKNAGIAFAGVQPPQSKGTAGAYCTDAAACPAAYGDRNDPLAWVALANKSSSQAAPVKGYPIIGTSNILLYTCYATADRRQAVNGFVATAMGKTTKDYNNQAIPALLLADAVNGVFTRSGLAPLPANYRNAITETFLKSSAQLGTVGNSASRLGNRNLWIQDKIPTTPTGTGATTAANSLCLNRPGA